MRHFAKVSLILISSISVLGLSGCQNFGANKPVISSNTPHADNQFQLQGKIGVRTPQQSGSAFYTWVQNQQQFDIELSGILGVGKTQITGQPGQVVLTSAKTGTIEAESPEELLERATGWQAPITHLVEWVQARPADAHAQVKKDDQQRITQIIESNWTVNFSYNDKNTLPNKLVLQQALENGQENRITMTILNR